MVLMDFSYYTYPANKKSISLFLANKRIYKRLFIVLVLYLLYCLDSGAQELHKIVNPFIGTGGHGHTFPGAVVPFGACQVSPDTRIDGSWDGCSGYHHSDNLIYGFSHTHLSGTGVSDWGDILLMPIDTPTSSIEYAFAQHFDHTDENAHAGYYSVKLKESDIQVELTASPHGAMHRYTLPKKGPLYIALDLAHRDEVLDTYVEQVDRYTIRGYRFSKAWANNQKVFFEIRFDAPIQHISYEDGNDVNSKAQHLLISLSKDSPVYHAKVAISGVDMTGAHTNLIAELEGQSFNQIVEQTEKEWDKELSKILIETTDKKQKEIFYTALYHCMIHPSLYSDVDGRYRGRDDKIHSTHGEFDYYTVFSLWDTYRALHPLLSIIDPLRTRDFILTFLQQYTEGGRLPMWELSACETDCMIGYHAVSVIWDAYTKGIRGFDPYLALESMISIAEEDKLGKSLYRQKGYLSIEDESESVSKTLEYSYDDWCIARMAEALGKDSITALYDHRSQSALNLFNWETGLYEPRQNGGFIQNYSPTQVNNYFTEGNAWQYMRGNHLNDQIYHDTSIVVVPVDSIFLCPEKISGRTQVDVTGLIGQYAHGNEPSHHLAFMIEDPELRNTTIDKIYSEFYTDQADGLIGNEDCGQMSAWYIWASLGMYPTVPGGTVYHKFLPRVDAFTMQSEGTFSYMYKKENQQSKYIFKNIGNNGSFISSIVDDKNIDMSRASVLRGDIVLPPSISASSTTFRDSTLVSIQATDGADIYYTIGTKNPIQYSRPFYVSHSTNLRAIAKRDNMHSQEAIAYLHKIPNNYEVQLLSTPNPQYTAGGSDALVDGLYGNTDWRKGRWIGVQGTDLELIIDLKKIMSTETLSAHFLSDQRSWIFFPSEVQYFTSLDGKNWTLADSWESSLGNEAIENTSEYIRLSTIHSVEARYIKLVAKQFGSLPDWHPGRGGDSFIFIDEVEVK